jgi:hypothetical protein
MNRLIQIILKRKATVWIAMAFLLTGCPLTVNLNVATEKPIALNLTVDKPINVVVEKPLDVKLDAGVAITKLPPVRVEAGD